MNNIMNLTQEEIYIELENNPNILYNKGEKYSKEDDHDNMIYYFEKALQILEETNKNIKYNDIYINIIQKLGDYYNYIKNYDNMIKCFMKGVELECTYCSSSLGDYYAYNVKNYELALKYYLITLKIDKEFPIESDIISLNIFYPVYEFLKQNKITLSKFNKVYFKLINKINFNSSIKECNICNSEECNIFLDCTHEVCVNCVFKLNKCPICKYTISNDYSYQ